MKKSVFFASKSKPLIEALKHKIDRRDAMLLFSTLNPFLPSKTAENNHDVLIVDEAHRIGNKSNHQFTKPSDRTDMPQIEQLIRCAKTSVFFIDDKQVIRFLEVGSSELIREAANKFNCSITEVELVSQFRCSGSDNYLDWLESVLGHTTEKKQFDNEKDNFDFRIVDSPQELYDTIVRMDLKDGITARLTAGFCWPWSKKLDENRELVKDVEIGDFAMP